MKRVHSDISLSAEASLVTERRPFFDNNSLFSRDKNPQSCESRSASSAWKSFYCLVILHLSLYCTPSASKSQSIGLHGTARQALLTMSPVKFQSKIQNSTLHLSPTVRDLQPLVVSFGFRWFQVGFLYLTFLQNRF